MRKSLLKRIISYFINEDSTNSDQIKYIAPAPDFVIHERDLAQTKQMIREVRDPNELEKHMGEPFDIDKEYPIRESMRCTTITDFLDRVWTDIDKINIDRSEEYFTLDKWMISMLRTNMHLPFVKAIMEIRKEGEEPFITRNIYDRMLLILLATEYQQHKDREDVGMTLGEVDLFFPDEQKAYEIRTSLWRGDNLLFSMGYISFKNIGEGVIDRSWYVITDKTKHLITTQPNN